MCDAPSAGMPTENPSMSAPLPSGELAPLLAALVAGDPLTAAERQRLVDEFMRLRRLEADLAGMPFRTSARPADGGRAG